MERAIQVMDYAIVIVSAVDGIEGHTETIWQLLRKYNIPTFLFINKTDRDGANIEKVLEEMQQELSHNIISITDEITGNTLSDSVLEFIAERDDELFEKYLEQEIEEQHFFTKFRQLIKSGDAFPCASGSALKDFGIEEFWEQLRTLTVTDFNDADLFSARVFKIRHDDQKQRITFMKALTGSLKVREELKIKETSEKVTEIRLYNGLQYKVVKEVRAGQIFAVTGISQATIGDIIGNAVKTSNSSFELIPTLQSKVVNEGTENARMS